MKPISPHDPFDDLIAAALHGDLTLEERTQFDARLKNDPAANAAYQEAKLMNDLLDKNFKAAQPDPAFEQRMVSGVRRKIRDNDHPETALESLVVLWRTMTRVIKATNRFLGGRRAWEYGAICGVVLLISLGFIVMAGSQVKSVFTTISSQLSLASSDYGYTHATSAELTKNGAGTLELNGRDRLAELKKKSGGQLLAENDKRSLHDLPPPPPLSPMETESGAVFGAGRGGGTGAGGTHGLGDGLVARAAGSAGPAVRGDDVVDMLTVDKAKTDEVFRRELDREKAQLAQSGKDAKGAFASNMPEDKEEPDVVAATPAPTSTPTSESAADGTKASDDYDAPSPKTALAQMVAQTKSPAQAKPTAPGAQATPPVQTPEAEPDPARKLIRDAQMDLEVKNYQIAMDEIATLTRQAGGYVDTSNSQRGGNGKLQGVVVVKVQPGKLDGFLLQLRDLGLVQNQSVSTEDVTKEYYDMQARLANSQKMEVQLQELLKRENGKVADLLQVERELGRVRGDIEQMQGQLKLYDFQVQYATVTMRVREKDLNQTAAYLLKENDNFSLFATDVEATFQQARHTADDFKAQILVATLNHNSGSNVSAQLVLSVPPDQIDAFLAQIRTLGRVADFVRETKRTAKDGGDSDQPADQTLTEKDKVLVNITVHSDDESRKQVALTVVTSAVDEALDKAKAAAQATTGTEILSSSLNKTQQGRSAAQLKLRVPGKNYRELLAALRALGRTASFNLQRDDNPGPGANGDDAPVIISLALTDEETPLQETQMAVVLSSDVDGHAQQVRRDAAASGIEVRTSTFDRQPDGSELAQMTFRLPISKYPAFVESLRKLGKVETFTVQRQDRPDQALSDDTAPVEVGLQLHNQADIVPDNTGFWATLRHTFGDGAGALFGSVRVIGVIVAFLIPWVIALIILAWAGRRIYLWRKK